MSKGKRKPRKPKSEGLGDTIEKITTATGIKKLVEKWEEKTGKDCGCDKRKELLNKLIRYRRTVNCMTKAQYERWTTEREVIKYQIEKRGKIENAQLKAIYELHRALFGLPLELHCPTCTGSVKLYLQMTEQLENIWKTYQEQ